MKKIVIVLVLSVLVLSSCSAKKEEVKTVDSYSVNVKEVSNTITQIDTTAIHEKGNAIYLNQFIDGKLYIDVQQSMCLGCATIGGAQGFFAYNTSTQSFEETPKTKENINGLPFKDGVVSIASEAQSYGYNQNLIFTNDSGSNVIYTISAVSTQLRIVIGKETIFVGTTTYNANGNGVESEKVIQMNQMGEIIKEVDVPVKQSSINTNYNLWFVSNSEVQTMEIPENCSINTYWADLRLESSQPNTIYCQHDQAFDIKGIDFNTKTVFDLIPESMSDYFTFNVYDLENNKQLVVSMKRDYFKEIQYFDMMAFDATQMQVGIYDQVEKRYIPITDENNTLGQFFSMMPQTVRRELLTQSNYLFSSNSNQLAKLTIEDNTINFTFTSFDTQDYGLSEFIEKDDQLFFVTTPLSAVSVDYPEYGLVQISMNK